jgi:maltooligosyltrehalose trehalohydrolase
MVFMGEEWGARTPFQFFSHMPDPQLRDAIREGRYAEFARHGWDAAAEVPDPNAEQTFRRSKLDWSEAGAEHRNVTLLRTYRGLIALRHARPELTDPRLDALAVDIDEAARTVVLHRGRLRVVVNLGAAPATVALGAPPGEVLLASGTVAADRGGAHLDAESFAVLTLSETAF